MTRAIDRLFHGFMAVDTWDTLGGTVDVDALKLSAKTATAILVTHTRLITLSSGGPARRSIREGPNMATAYACPGSPPAPGARAPAVAHARARKRGDFQGRYVFLPCPVVALGVSVVEVALDVDKVLLAIEELRRWEKRANDLSQSGARQNNPAEYARARQQITYYSGLLQDMKKRSNPESATRLIARLD